MTEPTLRIINTVERKTSVRVERQAFLDLCSEAKRVADPRSTMPILATALLSAGEESLRVAATDLLRTVDGKVRAAVSTALTGSLTDLATTLEESARLGLCEEQSVAPSAGVDAKKLHEVVKALPGAEVEVLFQEKLTLIETDTYKADKTRVCSVCRKRSASALPNGTCADKPSSTAKLPCGGKLLETSREFTHTVEVSLLSGKARFNLRSLPGRDFPKLFAVDAAAWHRVDAAVLREALDKVAPTISQDSTRSHLNGALLEVGGGLLRAVSTDGHRLTKVDRVAATTFSTKGFILPLPGVQELLKFLPALIGKSKKGAAVKADVEVALSGDEHFHWRKPGGDVVYTQKLEQAQFPPYDQVIPRDVEKIAVASRADLVAAAKRMLLSASEKTAGIKMTLQGQDGGTMQPVTLTLSIDNPDVGDASEDVDGVVGTHCYECPFVFGINGRYLVSALEEMTSATVYMGFNGELDPMTLRTAAEDADVVVIMPMRL